MGPVYITVVHLQWQLHGRIYKYPSAMYIYIWTFLVITETACRTSRMLLWGAWQADPT